MNTIPDYISEFHYIAHLDNLESILEKGILSHILAEGIKTKDISMSPVQKLRAQKILPTDLTNGTSKTVHHFANLYFNAKNPMLFSRISITDEICVLRIRREALALSDAVVADRNAATHDVEFYKAIDGINHLALNILFEPYWTSRNATEAENKQRGQLRCAELLVPNRIHPSYIGGMYVSSLKTAKTVQNLFKEECPISISVRPQLFFNKNDNAYSSYLPLSNRLFPTLTTFATETKKRSRDESPEISPPRPQKVQKRESMKSVTETKNPSPPTTPKKEVKQSTGASSQKGLEKFFTRKTPEVEQKSKIPQALAASASITYKRGDLLKSQMQTIVNTVNCKGVMGKGIALQFKKIYPEMFKEYKELCKNNQVKPGEPYLYRSPKNKQIINFPTKDDWKNDSKLAWIEQGLDRIVEQCKAWNITSIALPPLGCGNGNLDWHIVHALIIKKLGNLPIKIEIYTANAINRT